MTPTRSDLLGSAQRLSASRQESPIHAALGGRDLGYGCSTPFGIKARITTYSAATILTLHRRAQRLSASRQESRGMGAVKGGRFECSTPFGIKARITSPCRSCGVVDQPEVLNAFRHQGKNHAQLMLEHAPGRAWCSTPFGIKARITRAGA